jgi:hypothetical protein
VAYRAKYDVSGTFDEGDVVLEPVGAGEFVTSVPHSGRQNVLVNK